LAIRLCKRRVDSARHLHHSQRTHRHRQRRRHRQRSIVIRDGKIEAVGATVNAPGGAQTIDAKGLFVYPGMMDAGTSMGLVEVPQAPAAQSISLKSVN